MSQIGLRAVQRSAERAIQRLERLRAAAEEAGKAKQEELRAAYEATIDADDWEAAYQEFVIRYSEDAYTRQAQLHYRRNQRQEE